MNDLFKLKENLKEVEKKIGISFKNKELLLLSFIHRSYVNENKKIITQHNERLEFLGDTILNFIISEYLFKNLPTYSEGKLSHIRSRLINALSCAKYFKILKLNDYVLLGKGQKAVKRGKLTIFSDAFEALIGAIYLDRGWTVVKNFVLQRFETIFKEILVHPEIDYKSKLQEFSQKKYQKPPEYITLKEEGPEHLKIFHVVVLINDKEKGSGKGSSKKEAQQMAAEEAYNKIKKEK
jgi:ribonuclease-3